MTNVAHFDQNLRIAKEIAHHDAGRNNRGRTWTDGIAILRGVTSALGLLTLVFSSTVFAQGAAPNLSMGEDLVPAPYGYEAVTGKYVTAKPTDVYISPYIWAGKVMGVHLNADVPVEVLARAKGYDWLIVGKNGMPVGYVPQTALSQAKN